MKLPCKINWRGAIMKRRMISLFVTMTAVFCGCSRFLNAKSTAEETEQTNYTYTIQDAVNLQDFLLNRPIKENLKGKPYDMDHDGVWDVFDLCLMKRELMIPSESENDMIVVYFSRTNNTEKIAEHIIDLTNADSYEIEAATPYTDADIRYQDSDCRANKEQNDKTVRPEIAEPIVSIDSYDVVFIGYPIWWGEEPRIIDTFLESYDFSDKTVIPFCTSGSSGISASEKNIADLVPIGEQLTGKRFSANASESEIEEWLKEINIMKDNSEEKLYLTINGTKISATFENNSSADALKEKLSEGNVVIEAHDYGNFEKVGSLGFTLPRNDTQITTEPGDLILYQGNQFTIYYDENSWNFTKLGHVDNMTQKELKTLLGNGDVTITLSLQ